jgi:hypothetical protein
MIQPNKLILHPDGRYFLVSSDDGYRYHLYYMKEEWAIESADYTYIDYFIEETFDGIKLSIERKTNDS